MSPQIAKVIAARDFKLNGIEYKRGETVDVTAVPDYKVNQLLNQRYLKPFPVVEAEEEDDPVIQTP